MRIENQTGVKRAGGAVGNALRRGISLLNRVALDITMDNHTDVENNVA